MEAKHVKLLFTFVFILTTFLFVNLSIVGFIIFVFHRTNEIGSEDVGEESITYRYLHVDMTKNETFHGFVQTMDDLSETGFEYYLDEEGNHNLISTFDTDEYVCTATCVCEEEGIDEDEEDFKRRSTVRPTTTILKTGLKYLVAAATSLVAYDLSRDYFQRICMEREFADKCPKTSIHARIEDCEWAVKEDFSEGWIRGDRDTWFFHYSCVGYCHSYDIVKGYAKKFPTKYRRMTKNKDNKRIHDEAVRVYAKTCDKLKLRKKIRFGVKGLQMRKYEFDPMRLVRYQFAVTHLSPHCRSRSMIEIVPDMVLPLCNGFDNDMQNPTIKCVEQFKPSRKKKWVIISG